MKYFFAWRDPSVLNIGWLGQQQNQEEQQHAIILLHDCLNDKQQRSLNCDKCKTVSKLSN